MQTFKLLFTRCLLSQFVLMTTTCLLACVSNIITYLPGIPTPSYLGLKTNTGT